MDVTFPFKIVAVPNRTAFPRPSELMDFRTYFESWEPTTDDQGNIVPTVLFDLYAIDDPDGSQEHMGQVNLTSNLFRSHWGDNSLFFQHHRMQKDFQALDAKGQKRRKKAWKKAVERHRASDTTLGIFGWKNRDVTPLGDDPEAEITEGIETLSCPFAWLLQ